MLLVEPTLQMWLVFATVIGAVAAYSYDRIPLEISSFTTVAVLLLMFHFLPVTNAAGEVLVEERSLLAGFADPALITILALLVVGQALVQTGALNEPAKLLVKLGTQFPTATIITSLVAVLTISAVLNNTPVVVMFIPILAVLTEKLGGRTSSVMMPLSFAAILGGNLTVIGSSTNLLAIGAYELQGFERIGFFDFTLPGSVMAGVGFLYVIFVAPKLLPDRTGMAARMAGSHGKQFLFQMELGPENRLLGARARAGLFPGLTDVTVRMIQRGREKLLPPYDDVVLQDGDIIMVAATRSVMMELLHASPDVVANAELEQDRLAGMINEAEDKTGTPTRSGQNRILAEAVVAPASRLDGRTIAQAGFRAETGCVVLGVQRRSRMIRAALSQLRLEAGDVLLVMGERTNILALRENRDVLLMESSATDLPKQEYAWRAQMVFAAVVTSAASGFVPIVMSALAGAVLMLLLGCINIRQAGRSIDRRVFAIVGAALALGTALQGTGGAAFLAQSVLSVLEGAPHWVVLSALFLLIALLTNVLSNNATAVLFTPIAVNLAAALGLDPMPFLVTVIFAANCSFATPMSYQTNLLVMAPGHYMFRDFLVVGTPLIFVLWLTFTLFVPWYYGLV